MSQLQKVQLLSDEQSQRCFALALREQDQVALVQLSDMYGRSVNTLITYVEGGITLPRVAECLRLTEAHDVLTDCPVEIVHNFLEAIDFRSTDNLGELTADAGKIISHGRQYSVDEYERQMLDRISGKQVVGEQITFSPHEEVLEALLDEAEQLSSNPWMDLAEVIDSCFDGNAISAYWLCIEDSDKFRAVYASALGDIRDHKSSDVIEYAYVGIEDASDIDIESEEDDDDIESDE